MADPSSSPQPPAFDMAHIRARVGGRVPRRALLDAAMFGSRADPRVSSPPVGPETPASQRAAVAAILRDQTRGPEVLLIRRAEHPLDPWSGHMALPGGREQRSDGDLLQTAIRETLEEVSLDLGSSAQLLGRLDELPAVARGRRTGLTIAPFVFELKGPDAPLVHNHEVAEVLWAPLAPLFRGELSATFAYELAGQRVELPSYDIDGRIVWGLTHRMLESLFSLLR